MFDDILSDLLIERRYLTGYSATISQKCSLLLVLPMINHYDPLGFELEANCTHDCRPPGFLKTLNHLVSDLDEGSVRCAEGRQVYAAPGDSHSPHSSFHFIPSFLSLK